ncbi:MAG TPA: PP2C family protein-serine/threonine phosphatase, partial [Streptosporangiaceae bacterium]
MSRISAPRVTAEQVLTVVSDLLDGGRLCTLEQMPALVAEQASRLGLDHAVIYLADLREDVLRELTGRGLNSGEGGEQLPVEGSLAGRAFTLTRAVTSPGRQQGQRRHFVPVLDGTRRLGILSADSADDGEDGEDAERLLQLLASLLGMQLVSKYAFSDSYARLARTGTMNVAAEMQWTLMPPRVFASDQVVVAAAMEPIYAVGGDAFDYAVAGDVLHLAVFDAMGHDSTAGLTANVAVATCRNQRRQGMGLASTSERIEASLIEHFGHSRYVTALLADLDLHTGELAWVNRGHHPPVLIRGGRWTTMLSCPPAHPMGTDLDLPVEICRGQLEPGDRLLLYTDGVTEARGRDGQEFGLARFTEFIVRSQADGLPVPETLRRLMNDILSYHHGQLQDDATVVFCEWRGPRR